MRHLAIRVIAVPLLLVVGLAGCTSWKVSLATNHRPWKPKFRVPATLAVTMTDARPQIEREGSESTPMYTIVPLLIFFYWHLQGSKIYGDPRWVQPAAPQLQRNIANALHATGAFQRVTLGGRGHLELRVKLLHFYLHNYHMSKVMVADGAFSRTDNIFAPYANLVFNVQLIDHRGGRPRLIMERTVHGTSAGSVKTKFAVIVRKAIMRAVINVRYWTLASAREYFDRTTEARYSAWLGKNCGAGRGCKFNVIRIGRFHEQADLIRIDMDSKRVVSKARVKKRYMNITPPGKAGEWVLSPWDSSFIPMTSKYYNALAKHLTRRGFVLRRLNQFTLYHFFGYSKGEGGVTPTPPPGGGNTDTMR